MLVGNILLSAAVGMIFLCTAIALSVPLWIALVAYPAITSLTLLFCAAAWNIRTSTTASKDQLARQYSHG